MASTRAFCKSGDRTIKSKGTILSAKARARTQHPTRQADSNVHGGCQTTVEGPVLHSSTHSMTSNVKKHLTVFVNHQSRPDFEACAELQARKRMDGTLSLLGCSRA